MFKRVQRYSYDNTETEYLGRRLIIQERKQQGDWPLYQILISVNNKVITKANLSQVEIISLYDFWGHKGEIFNRKKKIVKFDGGFELFQLTKSLWQSIVQVKFTKQEESLFLEHIREHLRPRDV